MDSTEPYCIRLYENNAGLCNQLLALINGIILARRQGKTEIELSPFLSCIHSQHATNPDKIFDLVNMSAGLDVKLKTRSVFRLDYGVEGIYRDITVSALNNCRNSAGIVDIPTDDVARARLFGDHIPNVLKRVVLVRDGSRLVFDDTKPIRLNVKNATSADIVDWSQYRFLMYWYDTFPEFDSVFNTLKFHPRLVEKAQSILEQLDHKSKINVCHLRIESDAVAHWSKMNNMSPEEFQQKLYDLYRKYIATIPIKEQLIILTYDTQHPLVEEFRSTHTVHTFKHDESGREIHAILDLLIGASCTGTFIGCHNLALKRGSTFSYFLHKMIDPNVTRYFIDLDDLTNDQ